MHLSALVHHINGLTPPLISTTASLTSPCRNPSALHRCNLRRALSQQPRNVRDLLRETIPDQRTMRHSGQFTCGPKTPSRALHFILTWKMNHPKVCPWTTGWKTPPMQDICSMDQYMNKQWTFCFIWAFPFFRLFTRWHFSLPKTKMKTLYHQSRDGWIIDH